MPVRKIKRFRVNLSMEKDWGPNWEMLEYLKSLLVETLVVWGVMFTSNTY